MPPTPTAATQNPKSPPPPREKRPPQKTPAVFSSTPRPWTILLPAPRAWPPLRPQIRLRPQRQPQPTLSKNTPGGVTTTDLPAQSSCVVFVAQYRASQTAISACFRQPSDSK